MPDTEEEIPIDDMELLAGGEEEPEEVESSEEPEEVDETETEEEVEEPEEEEVNIKDLPFARPTVKEIKAEFPEFFKKFPELKDAFFREQRYTELYPTVEDAQEAFDSNQAFERLSDSALAGDPVPLLESIEKADPKAAETFSLAFLPSLYKRNQALYNTVLTPVLESLFRAAYAKGDDNMKNSAINLAAFVFGDDGEKSVKGEKTLGRSTQITQEQTALRKERETRESSRFLEVAREMEGRNYKSIKSIILKDFDPDKVFNEFVRNTAIQEIIQRLNKQLASDDGYKKIMQANWKRARANGYTDMDKSKIISTFLARARRIMPGIREEVRSAALGKTKKVVDLRRKKIDNIGLHHEKTGKGQPSNGRSSTLTKKDFSKMTDDEILAL